MKTVWLSREAQLLGTEVSERGSEMFPPLFSKACLPAIIFDKKEQVRVSHVRYYLGNELVIFTSAPPFHKLAHDVRSKWRCFCLPSSLK